MSSTMCSTCLSLNRTLILFDKDKYGSLFDNITLTEKIGAICCECIYMFRKLCRFKYQVIQAQEHLRNRSSEIPILSPLSCLSTTIYSYDVCKNTDSLTPNHNILNTSKINIKEENENEKYDDNDLNDFKSNDVETDNIKIENDYYTTEKRVKEFKKENKYKHKQTKSGNDTKWCIDYVVTRMSEEEMLAKRERDREAERYRNKVKYRCERCIVGFFHKDLYEKHMRSRHSEKAGTNQCTICETRFTKLKYCRDHTESHYRSYGCKTCGYVGYKLLDMAAHDAREHGLARFSCRVCREMFPSPSSLRFHRETTHEARPKCDSCGKSFRTKNNLRLHKQPKQACPVCGARVRYIQTHMRTHEAAPEAAYCAECDQRFASTASYRSHLKYSAKHRNDTVLRHECPVCEARFVNSTGLKKHTLARHSTVRPYKCDKCGKGFEAQCKLRLHTLHAHEGVEKPKDKICHICGRGFNTKFMLSNHIRVHTGEKPFRCEVCGAAFSQKSSLTTHTRGVHLKIRPRPGRAPRP